MLAEKKILNYGTCHIDVNSGKKTLAVDGGSSLLSSLAEQNIFIPSACGGRGSCAYCKLKVNSGGGMIGPVEEPYLSPEERKDNVRLSCQVKVRKDMQIEIPEDLFSVRRFRTKLVHKKPLTHDIVELRMQLLEPNVIEFEAGQYVQLESAEYKGHEAVMRGYSISSVPSDTQPPRAHRSPRARRHLHHLGLPAPQGRPGNQFLGPLWPFPSLRHHRPDHLHRRRQRHGAHLVHRPRHEGKGHHPPRPPTSSAR